MPLFLCCAVAMTSVRTQSSCKLLPAVLTGIWLKTCSSETACFCSSSSAGNLSTQISHYNMTWFEFYKKKQPHSSSRSSSFPHRGCEASGSQFNCQSPKWLHYFQRELPDKLNSNRFFKHWHRKHFMICCATPELYIKYSSIHQTGLSSCCIYFD